MSADDTFPAPTGPATAPPDAAPPATLGRRLRRVGPGILAAAAGVGSGDLVATMIAGAQLGTVLLWAVVLGAAFKLVLSEGIGRWHLGSTMTLLDGWRRLGYWATGFFGAYLIVWGLAYGATAMSAVGLSLNALFGGLPVRYWGMIAGVTGLVLVWAQRYYVFERFVAVLVAVKFVAVVTVAVLVAPRLGAAIASGLVPRLPEGSTIYVLGLIGGVGGVVTMAAYGYWAFAKGWTDTRWLSMMRLDNAVGYVMTAIFVVAMMISGAAMLYGEDLVADDRGLVTLGTALGAEYGSWARIVFYIGFLAVTSSALFGAWNGGALLFHDWLRLIRLPHGKKMIAETAMGRAPGYAARQAERSTPFRAYLLWITFPPMLLLFLDRPFAVTLAYGMFGAFFIPFLATSLLLLLNSRAMAPEARSGWLSNLLLGAAVALFTVLMATSILDLM
jgi:Mn2+/Fe2+ NRAMP family transporter